MSTILIVVGVALVLTACITWLGRILHAERVEQKFESVPRYCSCGSPLHLNKAHGASFAVSCANPQHAYRAILPLTVLFSHECESADLVPMGDGLLEDGLVVQSQRCVVCGRRHEEVEGISDLALGGI